MQLAGMGAWSWKKGECYRQSEHNKQRPHSVRQNGLLDELKDFRDVRNMERKER